MATRKSRQTKKRSSAGRPPLPAEERLTRYNICIRERELKWLQGLAEARDIKQTDIVRCAIEYARVHDDELSRLMLASVIQTADAGITTKARPKVKRPGSGRPSLPEGERLAVCYVSLKGELRDWLQSMSKTWSMKPTDLSRYIIEFAHEHSKAVEQYVLSRSGDDPGEVVQK